MNPCSKSLADANPDLARQAFGWNAMTLTSGSSEKVEWKCEAGHIWAATVKNRSIGRGCPYCANKRVLVGYNDLATVRPDLASQTHNFDPTTVTEFSMKMARWKCGVGHVWDARVSERSRGNGCPYCGKRKVLVGYNDLATVRPELAAQAYDFDPTTVTEYSNQRVNWKCELGHIWGTAVHQRSTGTGCPYCSGRLAQAGYNDLATVRPELAAQAYDFDPTTVTEYSSQKRAWQCARGHVWRAVVSSRSVGNGCPYCANRWALPGYNDLATVRPDLAAQAYDFDPTTVTPGTHKKVGWKCEKGHVWKAGVKDRAAGNGCPICAVRFFKPGLDAHLYFLEHPERDLYQIGVSNRIKGRLAEHTRKGWKVIDVSSVMPGDVAYQYEQDGRKVIKSRGGCFTDLLGNEKSSGYSEVWKRASFRPKSLARLIQMVDQDRAKGSA